MASLIADVFATFLYKVCCHSLSPRQLLDGIFFPTTNAIVDVKNSNILFNFRNSCSHLMNGVVPWRGGWEKKIMYMQILIEALTKLRDVVLDLYASTSDIHSHSH